MALHSTLSYTVETATGFPPTGWTTDDTLELQSLDLGLYPKVSTARITRKYGAVGSTGIPVATRTAVDYSGKFIRVNITDGTDTKSWWGFCAAPADTPKGQRTNPSGTTLYTGDQELTVFDLGHFLQQKISLSMTSAGNLGRVVALNGVMNSRQDVIEGNKQTGANRVEVVPGAGENWNASTALYYWQDLVEEQLGIALSISFPAGFISALANIEDVWDWEGKTFWQALGTIISTERGYICWLAGTTLMVSSTVETAIGSPVLVPANPTVVPFSATTQGNTVDPIVKHLETTHYSKIRVRGGQVRCTFTMSTAKGTLDKSWKAADQTAMDGAAAAALRSRLYADVYRAFKLPDAWDLLDADSGGVMIPKATDAGGVDWATAQAIYHHDWLLDPLVPMPAADGGGTYDLEEIQAWVKDDDNKYHRLAENSESVNTSISVQDGFAGVRLSPRDPVTFGDNHYTGAATPKWDWQELLITCSVASNDHLFIEVNSPHAEPGALSRTKVIDLPSAQLWTIAAGTVIDAYDTTKTEQAADLIMRDDSATLQALADIAAAYYGTRRAAISGGYRNGRLFDRLGQLIGSVDFGGSRQNVGTVISSITYTFGERQSVKWSTDLLEPELTKFFSRSLSKSARRRRSANAATNAQGTVNVPAAAAGSGAGASEVVIVEVTSAGANPPAEYQCSVWTDGYYDSAGNPKTADLTGETLRILQISASADIRYTGLRMLARKREDSGDTWYEAQLYVVADS